MTNGQDCTLPCCCHAPNAGAWLFADGPCPAHMRMHLFFMCVCAHLCVRVHVCAYLHPCICISIAGEV